MFTFNILYTVVYEDLETMFKKRKVLTNIIIRSVYIRMTVSHPLFEIVLQARTSKTAVASYGRLIT